VVERFLTFIPIESHTAEALATTVLKFLNKCDIDIKKIYEDNLTTMPQTYWTVTRVFRHTFAKSIHLHTTFLVCTAHSLTLVGVSALESCVIAISLFRFVQKLFNFFSASTHRWMLMSECLENEASSTFVLKSDWNTVV